MGITQGRSLLDETEPAGVIARGGAIGLLVARIDHDPNFFHAGFQNFFNQNLERRFGDSITIDQALQGQRPLVFSGGSNHRFLDFHKAYFR